MRRGGFSLVEISIVLIVVSVMLSGVLPYITESQKTNAANDTAERLEKIELAMLTYRAANGFIPCPSDITAGLNTANFGTATTTADCRDGTAPDPNFGDTSDFGGSGFTVAGGVPTKALGLSDEYGFDGWGRRMTYHVDTRLTVAGTYSSATGGSIRVNDATGAARTTSAAYAVVSHGPNGHGAYTRAGTRFNFGSTNTSEHNNASYNASGTATTYDNVLVQSMALPNSNPLAAFDDIVRYQLKPSLELLVSGGGGGSSYWAAGTGANANDIYSTNAGNVGIGATAPSTKLQVGNGTSYVASSVVGLRNGTWSAADMVFGDETDVGRYFFSLRGTSDGAASNFRLWYHNTGTGSHRWENAMGVYPTAHNGSAYSAGFKDDTIFVNSSNNVGIGTTGPNAKLSIANNVASGALDNYNEYQLMLYDGGAPASSYGLGIRGGTLLANTNSLFDIDVAGANLGGFGPIGGTGVYGLRLGMPNQWQGLAMDSNGSTKTMVMHYGGSNDNNIRIARYGDNFGSWEANVIHLDMDAPQASLNLSAAGFLGIGLTPDERLTIGGDGNTHIRIDGTNGYMGMILTENAAQRWRLYSSDNTGDRLYLVDAQGDNGVYINQNATAWTANSDRRLKKNVKDYTVLDRIDDFRAVTFDWKADGNRDFGVIAQEVYKSFPEVVDKGADDIEKDIKDTQDPAVWGVRYDRIGVLALEGVKELNALFDNLLVKVGAIIVDVQKLFGIADRHELEIGTLQEKLSALSLEFQAYKAAHPLASGSHSSSLLKNATKDLVGVDKECSEAVIEKRK